MTDYGLLCKELEALTQGVTEPISNLANAASVLYHALPELNWAGFYLLRGGALRLGPFMGKPACVAIPLVYQPLPNLPSSLYSVRMTRLPSRTDA